MLRLGTIVIGADDTERAIAFWSALLDLDVVRFDDDPTFTILRPADGIGTRLAIQHADTPPDPHPRLHIDLVVDSPDEQTRSVRRVIELGGSRPEWDGYAGDPDFVVVADTEGNRFCIVDASHG